jgi:hypothetical protein
LNLTHGDKPHKYIGGFDKAVKDGKMIIRYLPNKSVFYLDSQITNEDRDLLVNIFWEERWSRYFNKLYPLISLAILPPLILLVSAYVLTWMRKGFTSRSS